MAVAVAFVAAGANGTASLLADCEIARNSDPLRGGFRVQK